MAVSFLFKQQAVEEVGGGFPEKRGDFEIKKHIYGFFLVGVNDGGNSGFFSFKFFNRFNIFLGGRGVFKDLLFEIGDEDGGLF